DITNGNNPIYVNYPGDQIGAPSPYYCDVESYIELSDGTKIMTIDPVVEFEFWAKGTGEGTPQMLIVDSNQYPGNHVNKFSVELEADKDIIVQGQSNSGDCDACGLGCDGVKIEMTVNTIYGERTYILTSRNLQEYPGCSVATEGTGALEGYVDTACCGNCCWTGYQTTLSMHLASAICQVNKSGGLIGSLNRVKRLFAQSYGYWEWVPSATDSRQSHYFEKPDFSWGPPGANGELNNGKCKTDGTGPRLDYPNDYCAILPQIKNIIADPIEVKNNDFVNLTFNTDVDSQQLPLVMYAIEWGDGETTVVTGIEINDRPEASYPHSLYHLYSYWDLKAKDADYESIICASGQCTVTPRIKIRDNWGWCNGSTEIYDCTHWQEGPEIMVKEK
ncbi:MAG: hypothetical protein ABIG60_00945, partial [Patescibacteria group bacterium]